MPAPARPFPCGAPALVAGQPAHSPGYRRFGDGLIQPPFAFARIVQAQDRAIRVRVIREMMRYRLARRVRAARQQRLFDGNPRRARQDLGAVEIAPEAVEDPYPIRLVEGAQVPLPYHEPANVRQHPEVRPVPPH